MIATLFRNYPGYDDRNFVDFVARPLHSAPVGMTAPFSLAYKRRSAAVFAMPPTRHWQNLDQSPRTTARKPIFL